MLNPIELEAAIKLTPGLFGIYFLWARRGWSMLGGALGLALFLVVVPGTVLSPGTVPSPGAGLPGSGTPGAGPWDARHVTGRTAPGGLSTS